MNGLSVGLAQWWERLRYDRYWRTRPDNWSYGINIIDQALASGSYRKILDAGCGQGDVVAYLLSLGYQAKGVELSAHAVANGAVRSGEVVQGSLDALPFPDRTFDLVFSSEVLEHIPAERIHAVAHELVRVCRARLFLTISLRPSSQNNAFHATLRPRDWWEERFLQAGVRANRQLVDRWQRRGPFTNGEVLERGPTAAIMGELSKFIADEPFSFRGELEPWYFVFDR